MITCDVTLVSARLLCRVLEETVVRVELKATRWESFISRSCSNSSCCALYLHAIPSALCSAVSTGGHGLPRHAWTEGETINK